MTRNKSPRPQVFLPGGHFGRSRRMSKMKTLAIHAALLAGFGALMFMGTVASAVPAAAKCMIDEGNGRYTPCQALYKKCMRDEGNGRYTPCDAFFDKKKAKNTD
jgi:hypothetical protein